MATTKTAEFSITAKGMKTKTFIVAAVSTNRNSFGLTSMILISDDGEAWQVAANDINRRPKGASVTVPLRHRTPDFSRYGYEIPERLPDAPAAVVAEAAKYLALQ